jgi:hypothetical protein
MYKFFSEAGIVFSELVRSVLLVRAACPLFYLIGKIAHFHHVRRKHLREA